jgi:hypothetical protein
MWRSTLAFRPMRAIVVCLALLLYRGNGAGRLAHRTVSRRFRICG